MERQRQFKEVLKEIKFTDAESYGCETNCSLNLLQHMNALCQLWKMIQIQPRAVSSVTETSVVDEQHNYLQSKQK